MRFIQNLFFRKVKKRKILAIMEIQKNKKKKVARTSARRHAVVGKGSTHRNQMMKILHRYR